MNRKKILVIGIDSAEPSIVEKMVKEEKLPALKLFFEKGVYGRLKSTKPPISPVAWTSLITGKKPGSHGIFDFLEKTGNDYKFSPIDSNSSGSPALWHYLGKKGKRVGLYNIPATYPPDRFNGFQISGWLSPHHRRDFVYPKELLERIEKRLGEYKPYPQMLGGKGGEREHRFIKELERVLKLEYNTAAYLLKNESWDLFISVFFGTDLIQHYLWGDKDKIVNYYKKVDSKVAKLLKIVGEDVMVFVVSDHGAGAQKRSVYLNNWLLQNGYLMLKNDAITRIKKIAYDLGFSFSNLHKAIDLLGITRLIERRYTGTPFIFNHPLIKLFFLSFDDVDWEKTKAYSVGRYYGPIFLNLKGREKYGIVKPGKEAKKLKLEIKDKLLRLKDPATKENIISKVYEKDEIYKSTFSSKAADLIAVPKREEDSFFGLSNFGSNKIIEKAYRIRGSHRPYGVFFAKGPGIKKGRVKGAKIIDIAPTILAAFDQKIPQEMDGRVLKIFKSKKVRRARNRNFSLLKKVQKSQEVIIKAYERFDPSKIAVAWTGGKDSTVILHMIRTLFEGRVPFPVLFNDSTMEFQEVYDFIDKLKREWNLNLIKVVDGEGLIMFKKAEDELQRKKISRIMKINAIKKAIEVYGFEGFIAGIRRDEHSARSKEKYFSKRKDHIRIHPLLHFTEEDVWNYIRTYKIPYVNLYDKGFRSLGERPFTKPAERGGGERSGREYDKEIIMERLRKSGYW